MCTPDFYHALGLPHPQDAQVMAASPSQPSRPAVPANIQPVGSSRDSYAYNVPGPGAASAPAMGAGTPSVTIPSNTTAPKAPEPPNPLDPTQQQNRRANLTRAMSPYIGTAIT